MSADHGIRDEYVARFSGLETVASKLQTHLASIVEGLSRIDSITVRAKDPDRYFAKAIKQDNDGNRKYDNPRYQIQDQVGARITVFYLPDVNIIRDKIVEHLRFIEEQNKQPETESEFGYFGLHFVISMPEDVVPDGLDPDAVPEFFELQIKTLFQHAWSEAHHDLGYKAYRNLSPEERRKIAFTAAQAWGADNIFAELSQALVTNDN